MAEFADAGQNGRDACLVRVPYYNVAILKEAIGVPVQIVSGYKGTAEIRLAVAADESPASAGPRGRRRKVTWRKELESGDIKVVLQNAAEPHPELRDVATAVSFAKTRFRQETAAAWFARCRRDHLHLFVSAGNAQGAN